MSDALSQVRKLQGDAQAAFRKAEAAGDQNAMRDLEELFEKLLRAEDKLLLNNLAVSAAAVADLAEDLKVATRTVNESVSSGFLGDARNIARVLEELSGEMHEEIRHESAHEVEDSAAADNTTSGPSPAEEIAADLQLPPATKPAYAAAFAAMTIRPDWSKRVEAIVDSLFSEAKNRRYRAVERATGVPWWAIAILHTLESSQNFGTHLHNGDPLTAPTVQEPKGRPVNWHPGMTWEESAIDAITVGGHRLDRIEDWSVGQALEAFERYNGLGYRNRKLMTPYLWSGSNFYEKGKFVKDHGFDPNAVSAQVGAALLLRRVSDSGEVSISRTRNTVSPQAPALLGSRAAAELDLGPFEHAKEELTFPVSANSTIRVGAKGMTAKRVQEWCCLHGRTTGIDSDFGDSTKRSVELFQRDNNLAVTGEVDRDTWLLLTAPMRRALKAVAPQNSLNAIYLKVAAQHVQQQPKEVGGNNRGPWVRLYMQGRDGSSQLWCAGFVSTLLSQAARDMGIAMPFKRRVGVDALVGDAKQDGRFIPETALADPKLRSSKISPGSLFVVRKNPTDWTHVGIVIKVEETIFSTIEGNTNGQSNDGGNAKSSTRRFQDKDFITLT